MGQDQIPSFQAGDPVLVLLLVWVGAASDIFWAL